MRGNKSEPTKVNRGEIETEKRPIGGKDRKLDE